MIAFMGNLHKRGLIRPEREVSRSPNWRVPKVGRPFEGALLPDGTRTPSWGVMHEDAMFLERMKGQSIPLEVKLGGKRLNFAQAIYGGANVMKFTKFTLSPMQMADMTLIRMIPGYLDPLQVLDSRALMSAPAAAIDTFKMLFASAGKRKRILRQRSLETTPLTRKRPNITMRYMVENGLAMTADKSIFVRSVKDNADEMVDSWLKRTGGFGDKVAKNAITSWINSTLFDVFYTNFLQRYVQDVSLPQFIRQHPDWTDAQIASETARVTNQHFSSFGEWQAQAGLKGATAQRIAQTGSISVNETRAWLGRVYEMLPIPGNTAKQFWLRNMAGILVTMEATYQAMMVAGGNQPDIEHLIPFNRDDESPTGVSYSSRFMRPKHPFINARGGAEVYVDLPGQLDTPFRFLDPLQAISNRASVPLRGIWNQISGSNYFGEELDTKKRVGQAISDIAPIFVGSGHAGRTLRGHRRGLDSARGDAAGGRQESIGAGVWRLQPERRAESVDAR